MSKINAAWHKKNRMPKNATLDQRIRWHVAHVKACGCREMPASIRREVEAKKRAVRP